MKNNTTEKRWQQIDSLKDTGMPKAALTLVDQILEQAKQEKNATEYLKAILYQVRLRSDFEEDYLEKSIAGIDLAIATAWMPVTPVLHSIQAELYFRYLNANYYLILNRTIIEGEPGSNLKTWDVSALTRRAASHYLESLKEAEQLKKFPAADFSAILDEKEDSKIYRPTLFDLLSYRALDFFMNPQVTVFQAYDPVMLNQPDYFSEAKAFIREKISPPATLSFNHHTLEIFKNLIAFHLNDPEPLALIDVDLKRLTWMRAGSTLENKDERYMNALSALESRYAETQAYPEIAFAIANELIRIGNTYDPFINPEPRLKIQEALEKLESAIARFPELAATKNCRNLVQQISEPILQIQLENVNLPGKAFKALVSHKNIKDMYLRLIRLEPETDRELRQKHWNPKDLLAAYLKLEPALSWQQELPDDGDMQRHNTEIAVPAMPAGYYILLGGFDQNFSSEPHTLPFTSFWNSGLSFVNRLRNDGSLEFLVLDRENGIPMNKVQATAYQRLYQPFSRQHELKQIGTYITSCTGIVLIAEPGTQTNNTNITVDFRTKNDRLFTDSYFYRQRFERDTRMRTQTFFFTDRAIYRPGQIVYFKGIVLDTNGESHELKANQTTKVILYDANRRKISELTLKTNEYGSFSGHFALPAEALTGSFQLSNESGSSQIAVEEYKLPRFEVVFDTLKESYKLGERLTVHGKALAYAGNPISNATVKFRVTRQIRYPFRTFSSRHIFPSGPPVEILNGTIETDAEGRFSIAFDALPDLKIPPKDKPVFILGISADVTDIQGETQSGNTNVGVGYVALILGSDLAGKTDRDQSDGFGITATNLNGQDQVVSGEIIVSRLKQPERIFRARKFARPDRFVMNKAEHDKLFPLDEYDNENDTETWVVEKQVFTGNFNTGKPDKLLPPDFRSWVPGTYRLELKSKDAFGETVTFTKDFTLFSQKEKKIPEQHILWWQVLTSEHQPGQKVKILVGSAMKLTMLYEIELDGEIISSQRLTLNRSSRILEIPVTKAHYGGFRVLLTAVAHNSVFTEAIEIAVPDKRKKLEIKLETKRNRLEPGSREEWIMQISDYRGKPVVAEMLAGMYDASLDALMPHAWFFNLYEAYKRRFNWESQAAFNQVAAYAGFNNVYQGSFNREYDRLNWFGFDMYAYQHFGYGGRDMYRSTSAMMMQDEAMEAKSAPVVNEMVEITRLEEQAESSKPPAAQMSVRRDFRETAFFYPQLISDADGAVKFAFSVPESLTRWRLMGLAHTKDIKTGFYEDFFESNREVMVVPNPPRFLRRGDQMDFQTKVVNFGDKELNAVVTLELFDAITMQPVNADFAMGSNTKNLVIPAKGSQNTAWNLKIPVEAPYAVIYRVAAVAGSHSDGEENMLPVLTNQQLLTESMAMFAGSNENRTFTLDKLLQSGKPGATAVHHQLTLEFTSNPVWYAVQALPYLAEPAYRSAEALFNQYYANQLAKYIVNNHPEIQRVFEVWRKTDPNALLSNLQKNQDLKSAVIEETPWLNDALGEAEQKRQIAVLFEPNKIALDLEKGLKAVLEMQMSNGGWPWFAGMPDSRHVTQQLVGGFGRLQQLGSLNIFENPELASSLQRAVNYLDARITEEYNQIKNPDDPKLNALHAGAIQYLWARSYFIAQFPIAQAHQQSFNFWKQQAGKHWTGQNIYLQGMVALAFHRFGEASTAQQIMKSLNDKSLTNEELGMYWRDLRQGYYWHQAPIETQALLIECFATIRSDMAAVEKMQQWLIKQKQTQAWKSNRATAEAIYAILMRGKQTLAPNTELSITIGNQTIRPAVEAALKTEAGSGYFRMSWNRSEITPEMARITVNNPGKTIAWGGLYWQYFEQLDRITPHETPLKLRRSIMREVLTPTGPVLETVTTKSPLKIGEKMVMRIELQVDRDMEYVHMKDLRAPAFEPVNQISGYKYQGGLGYYESPRDLATHFFFQYLPRGTWVFEYPVVVSQTGDFSSGITSIQCLYAPEFTAHSEGVRIEVK